MYDLDRGVLSEKQRRLLKLIHETSKSISRWMDYCSMYSKPGEDAIVTITRKRDSFGSSICSSNNISIADEKFYSVKSTKDIIADDDDDIVYFESVQDQLPSPLLPAITITASTLPNSSPMYLEPPRPIISLNGYRSSSNISNDEATSARVSYSHLDPGAFKRLSLPSHPDFSMMHPFKTAPSWVLSFIPINVLAWGCIIIQVLLTLLSIALAIFETLSG